MFDRGQYFGRPLFWCFIPFESSIVNVGKTGASPSSAQIYLDASIFFRSNQQIQHLFYGQKGTVTPPFYKAKMQHFRPSKSPQKCNISRIFRPSKLPQKCPTKPDSIFNWNQQINKNLQ